MLRHPEQAKAQLAPSDETSLTRESLDALLGDARAAGMRLNTWIDIQQLGQLNRETGKIAYRVLQEGLTNASRHGAGSPVSLELTANPTAGVHAHVSNPTNPSVPQHRRMPRVPPWIPKTLSVPVPDCRDWPSASGRPEEHVDSVLTHDTRSMLMCSYHGLSEQRREQR